MLIAQNQFLTFVLHALVFPTGNAKQFFSCCLEFFGLSFKKKMYNVDSEKPIFTR